ncbi:ParB/RepB/Spo0J family partition protein [Ruegeria conchae]|uniref:Chromosome segregation DNA-binding protein n=1 Tax=Ruegeria conchae TaxID=981384 RepID=A0A497Z5C4_9RHOB|nr:ParB/RepB/Spo0J family partition protein [Ruegeria conchae]RLK03659.1 chromosome segregation DNA-binding protein [Ruegeria conchae]UWR02956.1 ParB/RepB/Spo0J family partition protein [Ruegeria conchae]
MNARKGKPRGLGRGLSALMADVAPEADGRISSESRRPDLTVPIEKLQANPDQPRRRFAQEQLDELAASVKEKGIIQPLIVRSIAGGQYEIVAGERRWRAAQMAQLHDIPVIIREFDDTEVLEIAIIENIQRADLNAVEEAAGFKQLMDRFGHTQEKLAEALGKSRSHIANLLRLLSLPMDVQTLVIEGKLSAGHARALITAEDPSELAKQVVRNGLSVRATEALVKKQQGGADKSALKPRNLNAGKDADTRALEKDLSAILAMKVTINHKPGSETGQVVLSYENLDQLDDLCAKLSR